MDTVPKKFLGVSNLIFILPDDFEGDITTAIPLIAEYVNNVVKSPKKTGATEEKVNGSIFNDLLKRADRDKLSAKFVFYEFDEKSQTYIESSEIKKL